MSMMMRRGMMVPAVVPGGLPAEYLAVQYLESTGTQYINVDDTLKQYEFEITALTSEKRSDGGAMITGKESQTDAYGFAAWQLNNYVSVRRRDGASALDNDAYISWDDGKEKKLKYICTQSYAEIINADTGVSLVKNTNTVTIYSIPIWLFHGDSNGATYPTRYFKGRIYSARYYLNGTLAYDLIPCIRISDSKPGMYDLVGRQFYTNSGTGEFIAGLAPDLSDTNYWSIVGYFNASGGISSHPGYSMCDYQPIISGNAYTLNLSSDNWKGLGFYDEQYNTLEFSQNSNYTNPITITAPANTKYYRIYVATAAQGIKFELVNPT